MKKQEVTRQKMVRALRRTWEYIAMDYLMECPWHRCKGSEVQEAVPDHLYILADDPVLAVWGGMAREDQYTLLAEVFPADETHGI